MWCRGPPAQPPAAPPPPPSGPRSPNTIRPQPKISKLQSALEGLPRASPRLETWPPATAQRSATPRAETQTTSVARLPALHLVPSNRPPSPMERQAPRRCRGLDFRRPAKFRRRRSKCRESRCRTSMFSLEDLICSLEPTARPRRQAPGLISPAVAAGAWAPPLRIWTPSTIVFL